MSEFSGSRSWSHHEGGGAGGHDIAGGSPGKQTLVDFASVQMRADAAQSAQGTETAGEDGGAHAQSSGDVHALAGKGAATSASSLPYFDVVQASFGHHDISGLVAHTGADASATAEGMGAKGYTAGRHVVLGPGADLFTVAHEAAHFIEQQHGLVDLPGGVGAVGDVYEQRANAVAAKVVAGESAEPLLDQYVGGKGGTKGAAREAGPVQHQKTELAERKEANVPLKLDNARRFERRLGAIAFNHPKAQSAATVVIDRLLNAVIPKFDEANADHQQAYGELFGKDNLGDDNQDRANGAWSGGQVGTDFAVLREALTTGNLREKMTGIYNAALGGFKQTVMWLMQEDHSEMVARGLDREKLERRQRQMSMRQPLSKVGVRTDLYRDPGNPIDRKHYLGGTNGAGRMINWENSSDSRVANPEAERATTRTVGDIDAEGVGLSDREKEFQYGTTAVAPDTALKWKEGGTWFRPNENSKWVKKYQQKLLMPVTAGPSGTAMRLFQAWEYLSKPTDAVDFRLALLGWMLTGNDHSFHEIMTTSAPFGAPYTPGTDAYRDVAPLTPEELAGATNALEGFPGDENYRIDHATAPAPHDADMTPGMKAGPQASILSTENQIASFNYLFASTAAFPNLTDQKDLGRAMAVLVYTDDKNAPDGVSGYQFINNALQHPNSRAAMYMFLRKDPRLMAAYKENKFNLKELLAEAKEHAARMKEGLALLDPFHGDVFRGYKTNTRPSVGDTWTEQKFLSMSEDRDVALGFAENPESHGMYKVLVTLRSVSGRRVGDSSMFGNNEQEVLFAPGTQFRVTARDPWPGRGWNYYHVTWQEVAPAPAAAAGPAAAGGAP